MATSGSTRVVLAALAGNSLIAITKYTAAAFTGSSAMFSEAIHSTVDTGNRALLLYGLHRAAKPADTQHPFGYGREIYFWAFVVAILLFSIGAGVSIYEGIHKIQHPEVIESVYVNYIVLSLAMVFEGAAWWVAYKEFRQRRAGRSLLKALQESKDAAVVTVLLEDTAAMSGLIVAFLGIFLAQYLDMPILDGVASVGIGLILALTAIFLVIETKALLIGEGASAPLVRRIRDALGGHEEVLLMNELLTMHLGPEDVLVNVSLDFAQGVDSSRIELIVTQMERDLKTQCPEVSRVFIEVQSWRGHQAMQAG